ncbi:MAG: helix-turn-helix transcriptional regulator [Algoriella sp.]|uniref:helix-turn-helix domain-containing protein n=1 Tax=Algoriella sp. TaxID=1872434 RepID=UPI002FC93013
MDKEEVFKIVGGKIREERLRQNITITEFADRLDIEYNNLIRIEKGRTNPTLGTLYNICKNLKIPLKQIMDFKE